MKVEQEHLMTDMMTDKRQEEMDDKMATIEAEMEKRYENTNAKLEERYKKNSKSC